MYRDFFGFETDPFNLTPDPRFLYLSRRHEEAKAALVYGVTGRKGFIVLTGEIGAGKTTLCRSFLAELDRQNTRLALVLNPDLDGLELLQTINKEFGLPDESSSKKKLRDVLEAFLLTESARGHNCALMIDEAQNLAPDTLEQVRMISNLETETDKLLQIVLVGQPQLDDLLHRPDLEQLNQRVTVRYHLQPLDAEETSRYIGHRLRVAKPKQKVEFTPDAVQVVWERTGGVPRRINGLCDRALLTAFTDDSYTVRRKHVQMAIEEEERNRPQRRATVAPAAPAPASAPVVSEAPREQEDAPPATPAPLAASAPPPARAPQKRKTHAAAPLPSAASSEPSPAEDANDAPDPSRLTPEQQDLLLARKLRERAERSTGDSRMTPGFAAAIAAMIFVLVGISGAIWWFDRRDSLEYFEGRDAAEAQMIAAATQQQQDSRASEANPRTGSPPPTATPDAVAQAAEERRSRHTSVQVTPLMPSDHLMTEATDAPPPPPTSVPPTAIPPTPPPSLTPSPSRTPAPSPTPSPSKTPLPSPTPTARPTASPSAPPTATPRPSPSASPAPRTVARWDLDAEGIVRVDRAELAYVASLLTWLERDGQSIDREPLKKMSVEAAARMPLAVGRPPLHLRRAVIPASLERIGAWRRPVLAQMKEGTQGLAPWVIVDSVDVRGGRVRVLDPLRGRLDVPLAVVSGGLVRAEGLYRDAAGLAGAQEGEESPRVGTLRGRLRADGLLAAPPDAAPRFDAAVSRAVKALQEREGLEPSDGTLTDASVWLLLTRAR